MEHQLQRVLRHPLQFWSRVIKGFMKNQGMLLSGAVAYYALLSIVPLITLILLVLSHVTSEQLLLETLHHYIDLVVPSHAEAIVGQMALFLDQRGVVSWILVGVLLFFSSMAFTVLENAISFIFYHRVAIHRRHFMVSAILPYIYILVLGVGFFLVSLISGALAAIETRDVVLFSHTWSLEGFSRAFLYLLGVSGQILILTSFYLVMPLGKLSFRHALVGGVVAGLLWELIRHLLVWYFSTLSVVNIVYGSFGTVIIILLSLEAAGMILLIGAQAIAEYERFGIDDGRTQTDTTRPD